MASRREDFSFGQIGGRTKHFAPSWISKTEDCILPKQKTLFDSRKIEVFSGSKWFFY